MSETSAATEWSGARGEKWRAHFAGMEAMVKPIEDPLIRALRLEAPCRIADVGCGAGGTAFEIVRRAPAGSVVHGFDISPALVALARERARTEARAIAFDVADMAMATADKPYDRLVSRFGVIFFDDPQAAFANLVRWLAPGGRLAFAVWGPASENPWLTTVRDVVAAIVDVPSPKPDAPGPFRYGEVDKLLALLDRAGLGELEVHDWRGALALGGGLPAADAAHFGLSAFSTFGELLAAAGDLALANARRALTARLSPYEANGAVHMDACVHVVTGARVP
jgi:SAM-dependent methyltransferase